MAEIIPKDRKGTNCIKWDFCGSNIEYSFPIADMDFAAAEPIQTALHEAIDHGVFGYVAPGKDLKQLIVERLQSFYDWEISPRDLVFLPGLVTGFNAAARLACPNPEDTILTMTPVYPPFLEVEKWQGHSVQQVLFKETPNGWQADLDALAAAITPNTKMLLFCNPHNPLGYVFSTAELEVIADLAETHDLLVCSDEIHCELILDETVKHRPIATLNERIAKRTITLQAPSKTFNIAGLGCSFAIISHRPLLRHFVQTIGGIVPHCNQLGLVAAEAAYRDGEPWRLAVLDYLRENWAILAKGITEIPGLKVHAPQATFLAWIDARAYGINQPASFLRRHGLNFSEGADFGTPGFFRFNFACDRELLKAGLERLKTAFANRECST